MLSSGAFDQFCDNRTTAKNRRKSRPVRVLRRGASDSRFSGSATAAAPAKAAAEYTRSFGRTNPKEGSGTKVTVPSTIRMPNNLKAQFFFTELENIVLLFLEIFKFC